MQLIAHRGVHRSHPENTLGAFAASIELDVLAIETDVRLTSDEQLVLFHDRFVGDRSVASLTRAELSQVIGFAVPTLGEALDAFPQVHWILELKSPEALSPLLPLLKAFLTSHRLMLISFLHGLILEAATEIDIDLGLSLGNPSLGFLQAANAARDLHPRINTMVWNYEFLDAEVLQRARNDSWRNLVYNTVTAGDDLHCLAMNVDGLITDRPNAAIGDAPTDRGGR